MSEVYSLVVMFDDGQLAPPDRMNATRRRELVQQGIDALRNEFPAAVLGHPRASSLSVSLQVAGENELGRVIEYLDRTKLARYTFDGLMFRAARTAGGSDES